MFDPARRKSRESGSPWRVVGNPSERFRDGAAPNRVVAWDLIEATIDADVFDRQLGSEATGVE